jgi:predicted SAM-dependent methyltransferase
VWSYSLGTRGRRALAPARHWRKEWAIEGYADVAANPDSQRPVRDAIKRVPGIRPAARSIRLLAARARRPRQLARYYRETPIEKRGIVLGCGGWTLDGWLCTDVLPSPSVVFMDATKQWPMPSESVSYVLGEHMLTMVPYDAGLAVLAEAHRVLAPGGILRISLASLDVIRSLPDSSDPEVRDYIRWSNLNYGSAAERADADNAAHVINRMWDYFGQRYLYDEATLRRALLQCGFDDIICRKPGQSHHPQLAGVELHLQSIGEIPNRIESLIFEATRAQPAARVG